MTHRSRITRIGLFVAVLVFLTQLPAAFAQQDYIGRYDLYTGFSDLYTPTSTRLIKRASTSRPASTTIAGSPPASTTASKPATPASSRASLAPPSSPASCSSMSSTD